MSENNSTNISQGFKGEVDSLTKFFDKETPQSEPPPIIMLYEDLRITLEKDIPHPEPLLRINGAVCACASNTTVISAEAKAGKTAWVSAIKAAILSSGGRCEDFPSIEAVPNYQFKAIVGVDTEQSEADHQDGLTGVLKRSGHRVTPSHLYEYNLRSLGFAEMKTALNCICEKASNDCGGIYCIFIDGIADLVASVNDEAEAKAIIKYVSELAVKYDCPVFVVIHLNPGTTKERGHLGSEYGRKCYATINITKKDDISTISFKYMRKAGGKESNPVSFIYSKEKNHHIEMCEGDGGLNRPTRTDNKNAKLKLLAENVFGTLTSLSYTNVIKTIMIQTGDSESTAKTALRNMVAIEFVVHGTDKNYRLNASLGQGSNLGQNKVNLTPS